MVANLLSGMMAILGLDEKQANQALEAQMGIGLGLVGQGLGGGSGLQLSPTLRSQLDYYQIQQQHEYIKRQHEAQRAHERMWALHHAHTYVAGEVWRLREEMLEDMMERVACR